MSLTHLVGDLASDTSKAEFHNENPYVEVLLSSSRSSDCTRRETVFLTEVRQNVNSHIAESPVEKAGSSFNMN